MSRKDGDHQQPAAVTVLTLPENPQRPTGKGGEARRSKAGRTPGSGTERDANGGEADPWPEWA